MSQNLALIVRGEEKIHCESCEARVGNALRRLPGVKGVRADHRTQEVDVVFDPASVSEDRIRGRLAELGYETDRRDGA